MSRYEWEHALSLQDSDNEIIKRKVQLGDSNFEYVEVDDKGYSIDQVIDGETVALVLE